MNGAAYVVVRYLDTGASDDAPLRERLQAVSQHAACLGLRAVDSGPFDRCTFELCCALLCVDCLLGVRVELDDLGTWWHPKSKHRCGAAVLRLGEADLLRRAMNASITDGNSAKPAAQM